MAKTAAGDAAMNTRPVEKSIGPRDPSEFASLTRMDLHCHSRASDGPAIAALGLIGCPECYSEPEQVYDQARARGMDMVTITDHDTIAGALELHERGFEHFIIGQEVTVYFPEDRCKLHVLVWGLTPELHDEMGRLGLRQDVYDFAAWLFQHNLPHSFAHPLYVQNGKLTRWHVERASLLFKTFETLNGAHSGTMRSSIERFIKTLTPSKVHRMVNEHRLEPIWPRIWEKGRTGGSDDHGLMNVGRTWTTLPGRTTDPRAFLKRVMAGDSEPGGVGGHSALLAHQFTTVGAHFVGRKLESKGSPITREVTRRLVGFAGVDVRKPTKAALAADLMRKKVGSKIAKGKAKRSLPLVKAMAGEIGPLLDRHEAVRERLGADPARVGAPVAEHEAMAAFIEDLISTATRALGSGTKGAFAGRDRAAAIEHVMSHLVVQSAQLPYLVSLFYQNKERVFLERFDWETSLEDGGPSAMDRPMRVAQFTDTLGDINGVSRFIRNVAEQAHAQDRALHVFTSTNFEVPDLPNVHNFDPVLSGKMPKYEQLEAVLPPMLAMLRAVDEFRPDVIHVSTPGPVGIVGAIAARMLRVPVLGVYHTDFPAYIDHLFEDQAMTYACERVMRSFYKPFKAIFTRSDDYASSLRNLGIADDRIVRLQPGCDIQQFHPRFEDQSIWSKLDAEGGIAKARTAGSPVRAIYVGRVSVEKNLPMLAGAWKRVAKQLGERGVHAELVVVGDGPYRARMQQELKGLDVRFLGFRHGDELSTIYASSDLFIFPSLTDTLGQVVMEAQSSGLPVIVSDQGGPKEVVEDGLTGHVLPASDPNAWVETIGGLLADRGRLASMGRAAHDSMQGMSIRNSFEHFWQVHKRAWHKHLASRGIGTAERGWPERVESDPEPSRRHDVQHVSEPTRERGRFDQETGATA